jgi:hypothetical protein
MADKLMFARLVKVDEAKREVSGVLVAEVPDAEDEIFDYDSSKPYFKAWNNRFAKVTSFLGEESSLGNVREMHQAKAVGKLTACTYEDPKKQIYVTAYIEDDAAWRKCAKGIYTGFSIGGDYVDTWEDGNLTRYTAKPAEASIVDNPAVPTANFDLVRADGSHELRKFAKVQESEVQKEGKTKRVSGKDLHSSDFAYVGDPEKTETWKLPIHDAAHVRNALARFDQTQGIPADEKAKVKAKIDRAAKKFGIEVSDKAAAGELKKGMYDVARLAQLLQEAGYLQSSSEYEREWEKDDSTMPEELKEWLEDGVELLLEMATEEGAELTGKAGEENTVTEKAAATGELEKARHSKATLESIHAIKGHAEKMTKVHKALTAHHAKAADMHGEMADCAKGITEHLGKLLGEHDTMQGGTEVEDRKDTKEKEPAAGSQKAAGEESELAKVLGKIVELLEKKQDEPADRKVAARGVTVTKSEDQTEADKKEPFKPKLVKTAQGDTDLDEEQRKELAKSIYSNPQVMAPLAGRKQLATGD